MPLWHYQHVFKVALQVSRNKGVTYCILYYTAPTSVTIAPWDLYFPFITTNLENEEGYKGKQSYVAERGGFRDLRPASSKQEHRVQRPCPGLWLASEGPGLLPLNQAASHKTPPCNSLLPPVICLAFNSPALHGATTTVPQPSEMSLLSIMVSQGGAGIRTPALEFLEQALSGPITHTRHLPLGQRLPLPSPSCPSVLAHPRYPR